MKYRITITLKTNQHPDKWVEDTMREVLFKEGEELIDVGIVPLEDDD